MKVSAKRLHQTTLVFGKDLDQVCRGVTLFPFFAGDGLVSGYMLVRPKKGEAYFLGVDPVRFKTGFLQPLYYQAKLPEPAHPDTDVSDLAPLWHYDPWWMLGEEPYANWPQTPTLKATNAVNRFTLHLEDIYFDKSLSRVTHVRPLGGGKEHVFDYNETLIIPRRKEEAWAANRVKGYTFKIPQWQAMKNFKGWGSPRS